MKRIIVLILVLVIMGIFVGCNKAQTPAPQEIKVEEEKSYPMDKYDLEMYTLPYWSGNTVYHESVMVLKNADGTIDDIPLLYHATDIISVRTSDLRTEFKAGVDYELVDGKLHIPEGSSVTMVEHSFYYPAEEGEKSMKLNKNYGEGYIYFSEGAFMHEMQIAVTYTHEDTFTGEIPAYKGDRLPKSMAKLQNGETLKLAIYGDSISTGRNSSGVVAALPAAKPWYEMFKVKLEGKYPDATVSMHNPSVPGKTSAWGVEEALIRVGYGPDLCVIAFGMNDGSAKMPAEDYKKNIQTIMDTVRIGNPDCEFILIATMMPNPETSNFLGNQKEYLPILLGMETEGVVVADMTTFHEALLQHKRYYDMSGNNVNHPNDFLARAYAHVLWQTVVGY